MAAKSIAYCRYWFCRTICKPAYVVGTTRRRYECRLWACGCMCRSLRTFRMRFESPAISALSADSNNHLHHGMPRYHAEATSQDNHNRWDRRTPSSVHSVASGWPGCISRCASVKHNTIVNTFHINRPTSDMKFVEDLAVMSVCSEYFCMILVFLSMNELNASASSDSLKSTHQQVSESQWLTLTLTG